MYFKAFNISTAATVPVLCILLCIACRQYSASAPKENATLKPSVHLDIPGEWMRLVNAASDSLSRLYVPKAVHIDETGKVVSGSAAIAEKIHGQRYTIDSISTLWDTFVTPDSIYIYELGSFFTSDNKTFKHLIIWDTRHGLNLRELEFIARAEKSAKVAAAIEERRKEWIRLCNANNPAALVAELYAENAVYYNHRPVILGRDGIIADYRYMSDPNYTLSLEPLILEAVTDELVFEIGQCMGSYIGKYILIWKKNRDGDWQVLLDSNI